MNRIDRLTAILIHLQSKRRVPLLELEDRFEVSRRTVFRDIRSLMDAGVPIGGDASEGYFIVEGYHLPPVMFDQNEAAALLVAGKVMERNGDSGLATNFQNALLKIKAVLRYSDKEYLEKLDEQIAVMVPKLPDHLSQNSFTSEIQQAIALRKQLKIEYYSSYSQEVNQRIIEPLGLVFYSNRWHLIAHCQMRKALRDFRTDRIRQLSILSTSYNPDDYPNYIEYLNRSMEGSQSYEVVVDFSKKAAHIIQDQRYYQGFIEEEKLESKVRMKFLTPSLDYFARWLMMFCSDAHVVSPPALLEKLHDYTVELSTHLEKIEDATKAVT
ncbi:helix-turn-helix transcriptional regulator [Marinoscillum furvescens]|uniref:Putative DNA-binding transcriptional regulator YafY n=1 Tax=Marinoscillum furvescens DSM 4134 TaxID=1122208 RepID=A0A3D9LH71_MARFU|nr:YafY family protein [Marinoscillum furvescens]REE05834.1 putative DNA-binding transcriptional regulator YafY [Marinoscillum furvescens DSM 4134]